MFENNNLPAVINNELDRFRGGFAASLGIGFMILLVVSPVHSMAKPHMEEGRFFEWELTSLFEDSYMSDASFVFDGISVFETHLPLASGAPETSEVSERREQDSDVYTVVDTMPEIVGGLPSLYNNIRYPREAISQGIEGRVYLQFIVNENGGIDEPTILKDIGGGCGEAAIEALNKIEFTPGVHEGSNVKVLYTLPVAFRLD